MHYALLALLSLSTLVFRNNVPLLVSVRCVNCTLTNSGTEIIFAFSNQRVLNIKRSQVWSANYKIFLFYNL